MIVELTPREVTLADFVAAERNRHGRAAAADAGKYGNARPTLDVHREGCYYELAFAKASDRYWTGAGVGYGEEGEDVGRFQVRGTPLADGCLLVRPNELAGRRLFPWVLVRGVVPTFDVVGWLYGREAEAQRWLKAPNGRPPAYFVPADALREVSRLDRVG